MASSDGSRSILGASDELFDVTCGPCRTDATVKEATHYCKECRDYLCATCKDYHRKLVVTKNHTILSGTNMPAPSSVSQDVSFVTYCGCNKNQEVGFYCEDHQDIICNPCKKIKHLKCKTSGIKEKSAQYPIQRLDSVSSKIKSLKYQFESMQKIRKCDTAKLKSLIEKCKEEIKEFRANIDSFLDKVEQNIMGELAVFDQVQTQHIDQHISALTTGLQMLDSDNQLLESAKKNANKVKMFITEFQVSKSLQEYEAVLADIETDASKTTTLSFVGNKRLADLQAEVCSLGSLKRTDKSLGPADKSKYKYEKTVLLGKTATSQNKVSVQASTSDDDVKITWITGCTFMPSGHAVLCDYQNDQLLLLDSALVLTDSLKLSSSPWDVSVIDDSSVIVTLPETKQLQFIQVFPQFREDRIMQEFKTCRGIDVVGQEIYTQFDDSGRAENTDFTLKVLDLKGNLKRKLQTGFKLNYPHHITISKTGEKIFVSDGYYETARVTCMTTDGNIIYQYTDEELKAPYGMYVDAEDNILLCDTFSDNIQVITAAGKKYGTLLPSSDGICQPSGIAYRETDDTLLVGGNSEGHIFSYKLMRDD